MSRIIKSCAVAVMVISTITLAKAPVKEVPIPPTVDISAIRYIECTTNEGDYTGSASVISPHVLMTAAHITHGNGHVIDCIDVGTGSKLTTRYEDQIHDFALMNAPDLPDNLPYQKFSCEGIKVNQPYLSWGITDYGQSRELSRMNVITATIDILERDDAVTGMPHSKGMRIFLGPIAPGMSGGPVTNLKGEAVAVNNAGAPTYTLLYDLKDTPLCMKH